MSVPITGGSQRCSPYRALGNDIASDGTSLYFTKQGSASFTTEVDSCSLERERSAPHGSVARYAKAASPALKNAASSRSCGAFHVAATQYACLPFSSHVVVLRTPGSEPPL